MFPEGGTYVTLSSNSGNLFQNPNFKPWFRLTCRYNLSKKVKKKNYDFLQRNVFVFSTEHISAFLQLEMELNYEIILKM